MLKERSPPHGFRSGVLKQNRVVGQCARDVWELPTKCCARAGYRGAVVLLPILIKWPDAELKPALSQAKFILLQFGLFGYLVMLFYSTSGNLINLHIYLHIQLSQ